MTKKEQAHQTVWETWFVISLVLVIVIFITGLTPNSKIIYPNWPYYAIIVLFNLLVCIKIGTHIPKK
jgi:membrane protein YdbS with pleckstrin-like domain